MTLQQQAAAFNKLKREAEAADKKAKELKSNAKKAAMELFERMRAEEVDGIKHRGTNYVPASTIYGQVQDRAEFVKWARENRPDLIEDKERAGLLNEFVRQCIDDEQLLPPGVGFYTDEYVSRRAA